MNVLLLYPPRAYARMPYLAPYLLKGFIEQESNHQVDCRDLNHTFHHEVWSGGIFPNMVDLPGTLADRIATVLTWGPTAIRLLQTQELYTPETLDYLQDANDLLNGSERLEREVSALLGCTYEKCPRNGRSWKDIAANVGKGLMAGSVARYLASASIEKYDSIAFSCAYIDQLGPSAFIASHIRALGHSATFTIGGNAFTHILADVLKDHSFWDIFDYGIPYEGEIPFLRLLSLLQNQEPVYREPNIVSRDGASIQLRRDTTHPSVHAVPNFGDLPASYPTPATIYPVLTTKGCYWGKCAFCTHHEGYGQGYSPGSREHISACLEQIATLGGSAIYFVDEALPPTKMKLLASLIGDLFPSQPPRWMSECRVERLTAGLPFLGELRRSGCSLLISGIETGSQRVMNCMKKGVNLNVLGEYAKNSQASGINIGLMFFIGFPGETYDEALETFSLMRALARNTVSFFSIGAFSLERGSPIWNSPDEFGVTAILGMDDPYRLHFDYTMADGTVRNRRQSEVLLNALLTEHPDVLKSLTASIDRSVALFLPAYSELHGRS